MSITLAQTKNIELVHTGEISAGGSNSERSQNVYHYRRTAFVAAVSKAQIFTAWKAAIGDKVILALSERYVSQNVRIRIIDDPEDPFSTHSFTDPGALAGESLSSHNAALLNLKTGTRGRFAQGKKFYSPIPESGHEDDTMTAAQITLMGAIRTGILAGFTDAGGNVWKSVILSKSYSNLTVTPANPVFVYDVNDVIINKTLGVLSGRRARVVV